MILFLLALSAFAAEPTQSELKDLTQICKSSLARDLPGRIKECKINLSEKAMTPFSGMCSGKLRAGVSCKVVFNHQNSGTNTVSSICVIDRDSGLWSIDENQKAEVTSYQPSYSISSQRGKKTGHAELTRSEETVVQIETNELTLLALRNSITDKFKMKHSAMIKMRYRGSDSILTLKGTECFFSDF